MATQLPEFLNQDFTAMPEAGIAVFYTRWNSEINKALIEGAKQIFDQYHQLNVQYIEIPGCVELTYAIHQHYNKYASDVYIAFGCVIRGGTPHFDYVCDSVTQGITELNIIQDAAVIFGVLTLENETQAWERLGGQHGHKGKEAALTALQMLLFRRSL